jgi:hypothetical protein
MKKSGTLPRVRLSVSDSNDADIGREFTNPYNGVDLTMTPRTLRRLPFLPRDVYRGARARRKDRADRQFRSRLSVDAEAPELVLSPHWDDAVLDCWSLLAGEGELVVVNMFAGVPAPGRTGLWEEISGARDSAERARGRMAEDARALALAGRTAVNLPLLDDQYRRRGNPATLSLDELDRALAKEVRCARRVYAPAGIGGHVDHVLTRRYARMLLAAGMPVVLYAELPYCTFHGWPSWVDGGEPAPNRNVDAYWRSFLEGVAEMPSLRSAEVVRLDGLTASAKRKALRCYETSLNYGVRHLLEDPAFHAFEVRWELIRPSDETDDPGRAATAAG